MMSERKRPGLVMRHATTKRGFKEGCSDTGDVDDGDLGRRVFGTSRDEPGQ